MWRLLDVTGGEMNHPPPFCEDKNMEAITGSLGYKQSSGTSGSQPGALHSHEHRSARYEHQGGLWYHHGHLHAGVPQSVVRVVQTGVRSQLLLGGPGVGLAVRDPEVSVHEESRARSVRQRRDDGERGTLGIQSSELYPQVHGKLYFF